MKLIPYRFYYGLAACAGLAAIAWTLSRGLTTTGLGLAGVILLPGLVYLALFAGSLWLPAQIERLDAALEARLRRGHTWLTLAVLLACAALLGLAAIALWSLPQIHEYSWYARLFPHTFALYEILLAIYGRALGLLAWLVLLALSSLALLFVRFGWIARRPGAVTWRAAANRLLLAAMLIFTSIHWMILAGQATALTGIPGWYWEIQARPFTASTLLFPALAAFALLVVLLAVRRPKAAARNLALIFITGLVLQFGFGFMSGEGVEWLRDKYAGSHHQSYAIFASQEELDPLEVVRDYEAKFGQRMFPSTKPPGVIVFYVLAERISHLLFPATSETGRLQALTTLIAYTFPFLAFSMVGVLYAYTRRIADRKTALLPSLLYVLLPNMILIPSFLDQALYPLLFTLGAWLMVETVRRRSLWLAAAGGMYFYLATFFSFSMLPLLPFFLALLGLDYLRLPRGERFFNPGKLAQAVKLTAVLLAGFFLLFLVFRSTLNYDLLQRYSTAMRVVRNFDFVLRVDATAQVDLSQETVIPSLDQILGAARLNLTEFAAAVGVPIFLLFLSRGAAVVAAFFRRRATNLDWVLGGYLLTFLALNAYGQLQGEVSRLWLFWTPMVVLFAGVELKERFGRRPKIVLLVVLLQLITIFLTFQFQDFIV